MMSTLPLSTPVHARWGLALLVKSLLQSLFEGVNRQLEPLNVTFAQCPALLYLMDAQAATLGEVSLATETDAGAMTRLIERLKSKGLCSRVWGSRDRRMVEITLPPEGRAAARAVGAILDEVLERHLAGFGLPGLLRGRRRQR